MKWIFLIIFLINITAHSTAWAQSKTTLYLVDYDIHTAIILKRNDFISKSSTSLKNLNPSAKYFEFSIGEEPFFREKTHTKMGMIKALFWPSKSLVRLSSFNKDPMSELNKASGVLRLEFDTKYLSPLVEFIENSMLKQNGQITIVESQLSPKRDFILGSRTYHLFNNCNDWLSQALETLKLETPLLAKFSSRKLYKSILPLALESITNKSKASKKLKRYITE